MLYKEMLDDNLNHEEYRKYINVLQNLKRAAKKSHSIIVSVNNLNE